jgi:NAD(P)-dependent dehydrogenase (short-subunit alcohol dehydrogenase family)
MEIEDKRVLITGASRGLGRALVTAFVAAGAKEVLAGARKPADLEALKSERVTPVRLDVTNDADVNAVAGLGAIDILVNNAGVAGFVNPLTIDFE